MSQPIYIAEDNAIRMDRVRLSNAGTYMNSGSVTYALKTLVNSVLTTISSGSLAYVAGTHGRWQGAIDRADVASLAEGDICWLEITLDNGAGADGFRKVECEAQYDAEGD